ncbi:MAG: alanine--tRNA ligase-related protein, partial [Candidatus Kariarchaeaceae archaeon]
MDKAELQKIFTPEQYKVELFQEIGHTRKQCSACGHMFWTLDPDADVCGDTSCAGGYDPYPVVARWRDDLEFTIASIADFQPWVTNGILPPPSNPLVVAQPCLRFGGEFNDLDNVGRTGRHLTSFTMFGQHAFNSETLTDGYWMDRCIDLNFQFLTQELRLQPEEINYVEGIWMGGGNFGPNLESMAFGTEIVNSVFMQYQNTPTGYKEMDLKVIDVGWGGERTCWFSQGTPTIYEATFGPVLDYMLKESGVKPNQELLIEYAKIAGLADVNEIKDVKKERSNIAESLGLSLDALNAELQGIEAIYAIGDHCRSLAFALSDGAIPSNIGGGYNLRTVIRRLYTLNDQLDLNLDLTEIIARSALYLSQTFPRVKASVDLAGTVIDIERKRYDKTIATGRKHVDKLVKSKKKISDKVLVDLYTSRGIPPETVVDISTEHGVTVDIPFDFYQQVNDSLPQDEARIKEETEVDLNKIKNYDTEMLYYDPRPKKITEANVVEVLDTGHVILDKTIFYPTGGGQAEDHGWIHASGQKLEVIDCKK